MLVRLPIFCCLVALAQADETHWAYQPPVAAETPAEVHPVDFLLAKARTAASISPAPLSSPDHWLDRAAYTLTGLPPSDDQRQRLTTSPDDTTWRGILDELLATPAYGERWARHWMDVARYADTQGYNFDKDNRYPYAYTYRDWLIRAFNDDLPYDQFIKLQIAADLIVDKPDHPDLAALGLLTVGPRTGHVENIDDRVDVITRGFLSTTVACARCHDHKTDPIKQEDYYSFFSIIENTDEHQPIIGRAADEKAFAEFETQKHQLEEQDRAAKQSIIDDMHSRDTLATYLELAWRAKKESWDHARATSEGFKKGRFRPTAIIRWREYLDAAAYGDNAIPRLAQWREAMEHSEDKAAPCLQLTGEWLAALSTEGELANAARDERCVLSYDLHRIHEIFDQQDEKEQRARDSAMAKLQTEHPGAPPRAMALRNPENWSPAQIYNRGNPADRGEPFERHWLGILGGEPFPADKNPRLALAERIADRANPLTARVMVNRVWAWHFGTPLADPGDFGPQQPSPVQLALLDTLAVWFMDHGWSLKQLHRLLLTSQAFRLASSGPPDNSHLDQANTRFWKWNHRRLDFESMRDRLLATAGSLQTAPVGGRSVDLLSPSSDHRRSVYGFIDRYAFPGLFVNFDLPHPDHHAPQRLKTIVPQQALYFLNNDLPIRHAKRLANSEAFKQLPDEDAKLHWIYQRLLHRDPTPEETTETLGWIRSASAEDYSPQLGGQWADLIQILWASNEFHFVN